MDTNKSTTSTYSKKKIAVFGSGWSGEYLAELTSGILDYTLINNSDVFSFVNFSIAGNTTDYNVAQKSFFMLPDISEFDGIILLSNSINQKEELDYLVSEIKRYSIPAISIEIDIPGIPTVVTDNYSGMFSLCEHLIVEHRVANIVYVSGPKAHSESQTRLEALSDAASKYNITVPEENILYGNWGNDTIPGLIDGWLANHPLPDAFICANDIMAIAVCDRMRLLGYEVPEEVIVTGYDFIRLARNYEPPISSVNHEWHQMGQVAVTSLFDLMDGKNVPERTILNTTFVPCGTCGCSGDSRTVKAKQHMSPHYRPNQIDPIVVDSHFRHFISSTRKLSEKEGIHNSFSYLFEQDHTIEGNDFALYLRDDFFTEDSIGHMLDSKQNYHYDAICSLHDGKVQPVKTIDFKTGVFESGSKNEKPGFYVFIPLYGSDASYGFAMLSGPINIASDNQYYIWSVHMVQTLEQIINNITIDRLYSQMEKLSVTDPLTGVYNRAGCESISYPLLIESGKNNKYCVVMLIDMDRMKLINDKFGHASGDKAVIILASSLKKALPQDFLVSRFGGDEFFVAGPVEDKDADIEAFISAVNKEINRETTDNNLEFTISASFGYTVICPSSVSEIEHAIVEADNAMYKNKHEHHKNMP
ncbi:MAG: GGDEF domain-containing protein [Lachnospiraceae bacterium]|nr:GGDEF domain-containing protein [Lachnospiraceae bacterium]